jgi:transposase
MMDQLPPDQKALFHEFRLENHTPQDHLLRQINPLPDLGAHHEHLAAFYTPAGRPSVNPEVIIYMLIAACCYGDRSQRRLCEKVDLNPACRWFCRAGLEGKVPDHCTFSGNRYGRFRESDTFSTAVRGGVGRSTAEGLVGDSGWSGTLRRLDQLPGRYRPRGYPGYCCSREMADGAPYQDIQKILFMNATPLFIQRAVYFLVVHIDIGHALEIQAAPAIMRINDYFPPG